jgi:hypothetical protein
LIDILSNKTMNDYTVKRLALTLAIQAEIEGMKVANVMRSLRDEAPEYNADHFYGAAVELRELAYKHDEHL